MERACTWTIPADDPQKNSSHHIEEEYGNPRSACGRPMRISVTSFPCQHFDSGVIGFCGKSGQRIIIKNVGDRVSDRSHDLLYGAVSSLRVGTVTTFLVGGFADATDRSQRAIEN